MVKSQLSWIIVIVIAVLLVWWVVGNGKCEEDFEKDLEGSASIPTASCYKPACDEKCKPGFSRYSRFGGGCVYKCWGHGLDPYCSCCKMFN